MAESNDEIISNDLRISCERWAIQSEILKINEMETLQEIHQYVKKRIEIQGKQNTESDYSSAKAVPLVEPRES